MSNTSTAGTSTAGTSTTGTSTAGTMQGAGAPDSAATLERTLSGLLATARADAVFGRPVERGETTVIPCAEIALGMGLGGGRGTGRSQEDKGTGEGEGYGGGGGTRGRPVAVVVIAPDGVHIQPVLDVTRIALAGMTTGAFMGFWLARLAFGARGAGRAKAPSLATLSRSLRG